MLQIQVKRQSYNFHVQPKSLIFTQFWLPDNNAYIHYVHVGVGLQSNLTNISGDSLPVPCCRFTSFKIGASPANDKPFQGGTEVTDLGICRLYLYVKKQAKCLRWNARFMDHLLDLPSQHWSVLSTSRWCGAWSIAFWQLVRPCSPRPCWLCWFWLHRHGRLWRFVNRWIWI